MRDIIRLGQVDTVRKRVNDATQALLGDTIMLTDDRWSAPSPLPGWSRAHVATHLARGADAFSRVALSTTDGRSLPLYESDAQRITDLERGAERGGLALQIDLDTSAGALEAAFDAVLDWSVPVRLPVGDMPVAALTIARLHEVVLHHVDLDSGFSAAGLDPVASSWLLQWSVLRARSVAPAASVRIESDAGVEELIGDAEGARLVSGPDVALWLWLTGRSDGNGLIGAQGLTWPLMG